MTPSTDPALTAGQEQVLALLAAGSSYAAAAAEANIHRNTIAYWRRTSPAFNQGLRAALFEKSLVWHEAAAELAADAADSLRRTIQDSNTPAGVRVKAALAILEKASTPPRFPDEDPPPAPRPQLLTPLPPPRTMAGSLSLQFLRNEPCDPSAPVALPAPGSVAEPPAQNPISMHKNAQIHRAPKIGRNDPCPCGSGKKFKRCCLDKPPGDPAAPPLLTSDTMDPPAS